ncbi:MAG TPA: carboxypeptidase-like regulatory domain-containing protein [Casimicrobiaceae bacterium]|nr:carboxypeptidase-like regulatory domain-containing protein [Casimicrobiaceae bacterium]
MPATRRFLLGLVVISLTAAAHADEGSLPPERSQGSVTYVSGGIGKDEADAMKQAASRYSLAIEMASPASPRAEYVADVKIDIRDQRGATVLSTTSDGPMLLAKLPPGRYTINASKNGTSQQRNIVVGSSGPVRAMFSFPE